MKTPHSRLNVIVGDIIKMTGWDVPLRMIRKEEESESINIVNIRRQVNKIKDIDKLPCPEEIPHSKGTTSFNPKEMQALIVLREHAAQNPTAGVIRPSVMCEIANTKFSEEPYDRHQLDVEHHSGKCDAELFARQATIYAQQNDNSIIEPIKPFENNPVVNAIGLKMRDQTTNLNIFDRLKQGITEVKDWFIHY